MYKYILLLAGCLSFCITFAAEGAKAPPAAQAEVMKADTPRVSAAGTQFVAPNGWSVSVRGAATTLSPPESGSHLFLFDVKAKDADAAVAAAWQAYDAKAKWPLKVASDRPARDGWEQIRAFNYETSANDQRSVAANALRAGDNWTIAIYDFADAVAEKRGAQVAVVFDKLLPKGYSRETFKGKTAHALDKMRVEQLTQFVDSARKQLDVPGVGLGLIDHGKVVFAGGLGVRALGKPDTVDAKTLFMIASNSKALTTLMLAREVDQKKFDWDTPVTQLLPTFKLGDADTTRQVLVRHLICACTGLPRQDMEWLFKGADSTPESTLATLGTMQPTSKFGELFQYSNLMAAAAGFVGAHVAYPDLEYGAGYDKVMQREVFDPLGMSDTTFDNARALKSNHAEPHGYDIDGKTALASMDINRTVGSARPAGGAWSNVDDMLRYVQMELTKGLLPDGKRYISEAALLKRRESNVALGNNATYGMGLIVDHTWGVDVVFHGGDLVGFHSDMMWLPEYGVGAVILTNADRGPPIRSALQRRLLEVLFDGKPQAEADIAALPKRFQENIAAERKRLTVPADAEASAKLAAHYRNAALGNISVKHDGGKTIFDVGGWRSEVASRKNDDGTLSFVTTDPGENGTEFVVGDKADAKILIVRDAQHEYRYDEVR